MNGKRKFLLTLLVIIISASMVFAGKMEAAGWITLATLALGMYKVANIVDKMKGGAG